MNREIKFRAWRLNKERGSGIIKNPFMEYDVKYLGAENLMQYSGLKDKNGKEIYEGDIVLTKPGNQYPVLIHWITPDKWYADKCPVNGFVNHESITKQKPEVIGNIYENPELLNETHS